MIEQSELRRLEEQCIQECAPACSAACPIHVDVRGALAALSQGDFAGALKSFNRALPFPGILGRVCDHPCQAACRRNDAGDAIAISALERACDEYGGPPEKPRSLPKRGKRVAIAGSGLSGLTAAFDLARKGYAVTVYEALDRLGGSLWDFPEQVLPGSVIARELAVVAALGVTVRLNERFSWTGLNGQLGDFDAIYLAVGARSADSFGLALDAAGCIAVDPVTYATSREGVFAGGCLLRGASGRSPVLSMADGRRAATSIDRYLQRVSLTAARVNEGPYVTRLYTNMADVPPLPVVPMTRPVAGYSREEAVIEARRCTQCECMECVKVCEYLRRYGRYPRKYVREIYNNLSIVKGERKANQFINSCSLCGLCAEVCPEGLDMAAVVKDARQVMVGQDRMPPSAHDFVLRDMQFSNGASFALARNRPGAATSDYVFFPGCQLAGSSPEYVERVYDDLQQRLGNVGLMLRCCGAPADWAGRVDLFRSALAELRDQHQALGAPKMVLACMSCHQVFKANLPDVEFVSLWELYDRMGLPPGTPTPAGIAGRPTLSIHDPCTARAESYTQQSARSLIQRLGYAIAELPLSRERTECCSYGGAMWAANPELAEAVVRRRIAESEHDYVTYCAMCRDFFAARGKRTLHLLDLIYGEDLERRAERPSPGYSQRHENRARLKRSLLARVWGEEMGESAENAAAIRLAIADDVQARLERRIILDEDIRRVIEFAERTGSKLENRATGHLLAHFRPHAVTYWVEYSREGGVFVIHNAYSHRMEIAGETRP